VSFYKVRTVTI